MIINIDFKHGGHTVTTTGDEGFENSVVGLTVLTLVDIFAEALQLANRKALNYGTAWSEQGYMGNVGRVLSKVSRLRNMVWGDVQRDSSHESIEDTLLDLVNLAAFTLHNKRERNKWGDNHI